jgi:putative ABC transport system permease protein
VSPLELLRTAASALLQHRGRSALTVLSITIGAFAIVVMSSLAESGHLTLERGIEELGGARLLLVLQKTPERGAAKQSAYPRGLTLADRDELFEAVPHVTGLSLFSRIGKKEVIAESGARVSTHVLATDARFLDAFRMRVGRGRAFTEDENRGRAALCVIGHKTAEKIGPSPSEPLGRFLTVGPLRCRIVGVLADNERFGVSFGFDWNDLVVVPSETMGDLEARVLQRASIMVTTDAPSSNELVKRLLNARLLLRHPGVDDFTLLDFSGVMERFGVIFSTMKLIVALLAGIALFVGGVGVMNMMLVAVSERVREIGLKKALGARPGTIGAQFLAEAVMLSGAGGAAGVALGLLCALGVSLAIAHAVKSWQLALAPPAAGAAFVVSMVIGVGFGWLPAKKAAALDPIEALRR